MKETTIKIREQMKQLRQEGKTIREVRKITGFSENAILKYTLPNYHERAKAIKIKSYYKNKEKIKIKSKNYYYKNHDKIIRKNKNKRKIERIMALIHYSKSLIPFCNCCSEVELDFLTIDHINNDGNLHRKTKKYTSIGRWAESNNYPKGFQVLCFNCNLSRSFYSTCPHQN